MPPRHWPCVIAVITTAGGRHLGPSPGEGRQGSEEGVQGDPEKEEGTTPTTRTWLSTISCIIHDLQMSPPRPPQCHPCRLGCGGRFPQSCATAAAAARGAPKAASWGAGLVALQETPGSGRCAACGGAPSQPAHAPGRSGGCRRGQELWGRGAKPRPCPRPHTQPQSGRRDGRNSILWAGGAGPAAGGGPGCPPRGSPQPSL